MKKWGLVVILTIIITFCLSTDLFHNLSINYDMSVFVGGENVVFENNNHEFINGTLTYIDQNNNFGSIAHKESDTFNILHILPVDSITKSTNDEIGEKNIVLNNLKSDGKVNVTNNYGLFGNVNNTLNQKELVKVAMPTEIKKGKAYIVTNVDNTIKKYKINIITTDLISKDHNIVFEIVDDDLLNKTGGIIKGMSGSPILQNNKIIGACSHVNGSDAKVGYALFITNMLKNKDGDTNETYRLF